MAFEDSHAGLFMAPGVVKNRKIQSISRLPHIHWNDEPDLVNTASACGGYNTVIEFSSPVCLRIFNAEANLNGMLNGLDIGLPSGSLKNLLSGGQVQSPVLNTLNRYLSDDSGGSISLVFSPQDLEFISEKRVLLTYNTVMYLKPGQLIRLPAAAVWEDQQQILTRGIPADIPPSAVPNFSRIYIDSFILQIECDIHAAANKTYGTVEVFADLAAGNVNPVITTLDGTLIFSLLQQDGRSIHQVLQLTKSIHVTPEYSLVGVNYSHEAVTEINNLEAELIPVRNGTLQALAVCLNLTYFCKGIKNEVQHFIGTQDYGVISDEVHLNQLMMNKWRQYQLPRLISLPASGSITVTRNGEDIEGTMYGRYALQTLDVVTILPDANSRKDVVVFAGTAIATIQYAVLVNGDKLYPGQVDFGPSVTKPWVAVFDLDLVDHLSSISELRQFQEVAHERAFQFIAKPFAQKAIVDTTIPTYCRVEGVHQQIIVLGNMTWGTAHP